MSSPRVAILSSLKWPDSDLYSGLLVFARVNSEAT